MKIIESITIADISVDEIMHKFREQIQKCMREKFLFFYLNTNYSLFSFIVQNQDSFLKLVYVQTMKKRHSC